MANVKRWTLGTRKGKGGVRAVAIWWNGSWDEIEDKPDTEYVLASDYDLLAKELTESKAENALLKADVDKLRQIVTLGYRVTDDVKNVLLVNALRADFDPRTYPLEPCLQANYPPEPPVKQGEEKRG